MKTLEQKVAFLVIVGINLCAFTFYINAVHKAFA
jgi:hypothetical protein